MTKNYGRWNDVSYYPNCNRVAGKLAEYSTEKILYGDTMEIQVRNYFSNEYLKLGSFEMHILVRVAASHGLTKGQLERFLILQGMKYDPEVLEDRLYNLVRYGYLSWVKFRSTKDTTEIILYDISGRGIAVLKNNELPYQNPAVEYFSSGDLFRFTRTKIVSNQIILHLLCKQENFKFFYFQREFMPIGSKLREESITMPLHVQTDMGNYIFEFVGNTRKGREVYQERMEKMIKIPGLFPKGTTLVIVAETYSHMEMLVSDMVKYEKRNLPMEVLYTHDSEWANDTIGHFYAMARVMGQSGLMNVKLL